MKPPELKGLVVSYKDNVSNKERGDIGEELLEKWRACSDDGKIQGFSIFSEKMINILNLVNSFILVL